VKAGHRLRVYRRGASGPTGRRIAGWNVSPNQFVPAEERAELGALHRFGSPERLGRPQGDSSRSSVRVSASALTNLKTSRAVAARRRSRCDLRLRPGSSSPGRPGALAFLEAHCSGRFSGGPHPRRAENRRPRPCARQTSSAAFRLHSRRARPASIRLLRSRWKRPHERCGKENREAKRFAAGIPLRNRGKRRVDAGPTASRAEARAPGREREHEQPIIRSSSQTSRLQKAVVSPRQCRAGGRTLPGAQLRGAPLDVG